MVSNVVSPVAQFGHIHSDDQSSETQGFDFLDQVFVELPVWMHIELKPLEARGGSGSDVFQGTGSKHAGDVADPGCLGCCKANEQLGLEGRILDGGEKPSESVLPLTSSP